MNTHITPPRFAPSIRDARIGAVLALLAGLTVFAPDTRAQTATWAGGNAFLGYNTAANWSPAGVPLGVSYTVIIPDSNSLVFDAPADGVVDALNFGAGSALRFTNNHALTVNGPAVVRGQIEAAGAGSAFRAPANVTVLSANPRLLATAGGQIQVGASSYAWERYNANATLVSASGAGSRVDLKNVSSLTVSYGDGGAWTYVVAARTNGVVDLSGLAQVTGPTQDDTLAFIANTDGQLKLDALRRTEQRVSFDINVPAFNLPAYETASGTAFALAANVTSAMPSLISFSSGSFALANGASIDAPKLTTLDTVPITLTGNAIFKATNLAAYRNTHIPITPGRNFQPGLLTDINGSRLTVSNGAAFKIGALAYETYPDLRAHTTLLGADGAGSLLNASSLKSIKTYGGHGGYWNGDFYNAWNYGVTADHNGILDLGGLETVTGCDPYGYNGDDYLEFNFRNGGEIRLNSLRQVSRLTRFNINIPRVDLPALETVDYATFNIGDGSRLNVPSLGRVEACTLNFGFNSTLNAPVLGQFINTFLDISPGVLVNAPSFTNITASRFSVSGSTSLTIGAPAYETYGDWRWSPTLFYADGAGSILNLSAMKTLRAYGGHGGAWSYDLTANNNGVIDLSGLEKIYGCAVNDYSADDWLTFNLQIGGSVRLDSLREITGRTRFNVGVPLLGLPSLETAGNTRFTLGDSTTVSAPKLRQLAGGSINFGLGGTFSAPLISNLVSSSIALGANSTFNAPNLATWESSSVSFGLNSTCNVPNLLSFRYSDLAIDPTRTFNGPAFTNIYASRFSVSGGMTLHVAAPDYELYPDARGHFGLFVADGAGSLLDAASVKSITVYGGHGGYWGPTHYNAWNYGVTADHNAVLDLSGLETAIGCESGYNNDDFLVFTVRNGATLRLDDLRHVTRRTEFDIQVPNFSLPRLEDADSTTFNVGDGVHFSAPNLASLDTCSWTLGFSTVDVPKLESFTSSALDLTAGRVFNTAPFTNIYSSRFSVASGSSLRIAAPTYTVPADWRWSPTLFSADGFGSLLDFSSIRSMTIPGGHGGAWTYSMTANNFATLDLSGLDTILGADNASYSNNDWLALSAAAGATLRLGNADVRRRAALSVNGAGSLLSLESLNLHTPATLTAAIRGTVEVAGDFTFDHTDPNQMPFDGGVLQMDGASPQGLEVGGKNLGPGGASSRNFGYSQLVVGSATRSSVVHLQDFINNGQRGPAGESEALYLYGLDGQGLRLLNNSRLILNGIPVYVFYNGQMRSLADLLAGGANSAAFDGGFIATLGGPSIASLAPAGPVTPPLSSVTVTFDSPIKPSTFTVADVQITGPGGAIAPTGVALVSGNTYRINFAAQAASGAYAIRVGPAIDEAAGNFSGMDQNGNGLAGEPSDAFTGTIVVDGTPPQILGALAVQNGTYVGLTFNEPVTPLSATNPANYTVNGLAPTSASLQAGGTQVALTVPPIVGETFALTVTNVSDPLGNLTRTAFPGTTTSFASIDIGTVGSNPLVPGTALTFTGTDFDIAAGGSDFYWGTADAGHLLGETRTGDFDVQVQVTRILRTETFTQAGIMWRESAAANSRRVYACINDPNSPNRYWALIRYSPGAGGTEFPGSPGPGIGSLPTWIRLKRTGDTFIAYRGSDGTNWVEYGRVTADMADTGVLGLGSDARNNTAGAIASFSYRNYSDIGPAIFAQPQSQAVASGSSISLGVAARGLPLLSYQWYFNGSPIAGANAALLPLPAVTTANAGDYRVVVANAYGAATSIIASVVVDGVGAGGFEADVAPTPYGNNSVTVSDWTRVGRIVAGLDAPVSSSDFRRADCAPRTNVVLGTLPLGDGRFTVADWTQAGRYAAALDPLTPAGGPSSAAVGLMSTRSRSIRLADDTGTARQVRLATTSPATDGTLEIRVQLLASGAENAVGFSLAFNPEQLTFLRTALDAESAGASLQLNTALADQGRLGFALAQPVDHAFAAGTVTLVRVQFKPTWAAPGWAAIDFADQPVVREVANAEAGVEPALFVNGGLLLEPPGLVGRSVRLTAAGTEFQLRGQPGVTYRVEVSEDLDHWRLLSVQTAGETPLPVLDPDTARPSCRFYRALPQP